MALNPFPQLGPWKIEIPIVLQILTDENFHQVFTSITGTRNEVISKQEAIQMIISMSPYPSFILEHPKITIDVLVKYFQIRDVQIPRGPKREMIEYCLKLWNYPLSDMPAAAGPTTINRILPGPTTINPILPGSTTINRILPDPTAINPLLPGPTTINPILPCPTTINRILPVPTTINPIVPGPTTINPIVPGPTTINPIVPGPTTINPMPLGFINNIDQRFINCDVHLSFPWNPNEQQSHQRQSQ